MKFFRKPLINAAITLIVSIFYAFIFILISGHMEFERVLNHTDTLNSPFWNTWSAFLRQVNMKYIGYAYMVVAGVIAILSFIRKRDYDEYQISILEKVFITMGETMMLVFPIALILALSDPLYSIETIMFLVVIHWSVVLIADFVYVIKWSK